MARWWHIPKCVVGVFLVDALLPLAKLALNYRLHAGNREVHVTGGYHHQRSDWAITHPILWTTACCLLGAGVFCLLTSTVEGCEAWIQAFEEHALTKGLRLRPIFRSGLPAWRRRHPALRKGILALGALASVATISSTFGLPWGATTVTLGPSYPLAALNDTIYYGLSEAIVANPHRPAEPEYAVDDVPVPAFLRSSALFLPGEQLEELNRLLEKSIKRLSEIRWPRKKPRRRQRRRREDGTFEFVEPEPEPEPVDPPVRHGKTVFRDTRTEGMGFDVDTFFSGLDTARLGLAPYLAPGHLVGAMYSNNVSATCHDVTTQYAFRKWHIIPDPLALHRRRSFADFDRWQEQGEQAAQSPANRIEPGRVGELEDHLGASFYVMYTDGGTRNMYTAVQVLFFRPAAPRVIECGYAVSEFSRMALVPGPEEPINGAPWITNGQCLNGLFAYPPAAAINHLLSREGNGLATMEMGWQPSLRLRFLEDLLGEVAQGYYSLVRQRVERADVRLTADQLVDERALWKVVLFNLPDELWEWVNWFSTWMLKLFGWALKLEACRVFLPDFFQWVSFINFVGYERVEVPEGKEDKGVKEKQEGMNMEESEKTGSLTPISEEEFLEEKV